MNVDNSKIVYPDMDEAMISLHKGGVTLGYGEGDDRSRTKIIIIESSNIHSRANGSSYVVEGGGPGEDPEIVNTRREADLVASHREGHPGPRQDILTRAFVTEMSGTVVSKPPT